MNINTIVQIAAVVLGSGVLGWNYWPVIQKIILPDKGDGGEDPNMPFDIGCILALAKQLALRGESELAERLRELPAKRFEDLPENDNPQT